MRRAGLDGHTLFTWAEYLRIHSTIIGQTDRADLPSMMRLYRACQSVGLPVSVADDVVLSCTEFDPARIATSLASLRASTLRFSLLADCYEMARAAKIAPFEDEALLRALAAELGITIEQQNAIAAYLRARDPDAREHCSWRDDSDEIQYALRWLHHTGASLDDVTERDRILVCGPYQYFGLQRICREVLVR